jgi:hypothetical protein
VKIRYCGACGKAVVFAGTDAFGDIYLDEKDSPLCPEYDWHMPIPVYLNE